MGGGKACAGGSGAVKNAPEKESQVHGFRSVMNTTLCLYQQVLHYCCCILLKKNFITSRLMADVVQCPTFS